MKILHIVRQFHPMIGGMEKYVYNLSKQQISQGDEVTVLTLNRNFMTGEVLPQTDELEQIKIIRIPYRGINKYPVAWSTLKHLRPYDILHIHGVDFFVDFITLTKVFHHKKIVLHTHGGYFHTRWGFWFKKIYFNTVTRFTINLCNKVIAISENDFKPFSRLTRKIVQVENGIDVEKYRQPKMVERSTLLTVGRIDVHKRIDLLIKATLHLADAGVPVNLRIVGPDWKGLADDLKASIPADKQPFITFVGPVDEIALAEEYARAHLFLSASEYEGFGLTAVEAMASGTPVVLSNIESFRMFLSGKEFGSIADFNATEATARTILKFLTMPNDEYARISVLAREYAGSYAWPGIESKIRDVYREVLSRSVNVPGEKTVYLSQFS